MLTLPTIRRCAAALALTGAIALGQGIERTPSDKIQMAKNTENYLRYLKEARTEQIMNLLDTTEAKASATAAAWAALEAPIRRIRQDAKTTKDQMQSILLMQLPEHEKSRRVKPFFEQYMELRKDLAHARQKLYHELPAMGETPTQQAQLLFLMEEMNRREKNALKAMMTKKKKAAGQN